MKASTAGLVNRCRALGLPHLLEAVAGLAEQARALGWTYEEFLDACLARELAARLSTGTETGILATRWPDRWTIDDYDVDCWSDDNPLAPAGRSG